MAQDDRDSAAVTLIAQVRGYVRDVYPDMPASTQQKMKTAIGS